LKSIIRKRVEKYDGKMNYDLDDFGNSSEAYQYSGLPKEKITKIDFIY
jgi:FPC/CPF motif-containing protein YcgG